MSSQKKLQSLLDEQIKNQAELKKLQSSIQTHQEKYFSNNFQNGNIAYGWNFKNPTQKKKSHWAGQKIKLKPCDKIFSLSSVSSSVNKQLDKNSGQMLLPYCQLLFNLKQKSKVHIIRKRRRLLKTSGKSNKNKKKKEKTELK